MIFFQSCLALKNGATRVWDENCSVPYLYKDKLWCTYEDEESARQKVSIYIFFLTSLKVFKTFLKASKKSVSQ